MLSVALTLAAAWLVLTQSRPPNPQTILYTAGPSHLFKMQSEILSPLLETFLWLFRTCRIKSKSPSKTYKALPDRSYNFQGFWPSPLFSALLPILLEDKILLWLSLFSAWILATCFFVCYFSIAECLFCLFLEGSSAARLFSQMQLTTNSFLAVLEGLVFAYIS